MAKTVVLDYHGHGVTTVLTDAKCKNASAGELKLRKLSDGGGLYLWVYDDGRKNWRLRYWHGGREKTLSLGVYPAVSLKDARARCDKERRRLGDGLDPSAERRADKLRAKLAAENSFAAVAREWYQKQLHIWTASHAPDSYPWKAKNRGNLITGSDVAGTVTHHW